MTSQVMTTTPDDLEHAVGVVVLAFSGDPMARWTYPDPRHYLTHFPKAVKAFGVKAVAHGTANHLSGFAGAAMWLPPGVLPDEEALGGVLQATVAPSILNEVFGVFERMAGYHPVEPHWYLPLIGVDPACQRQGHGAALLRHTLSRCDREHATAYLESSNPANIPLYERHGFEVLDTIRVGSSPPVFPMLRPAR